MTVLVCSRWTFLDRNGLGEWRTHAYLPEAKTTLCGRYSTSSAIVDNAPATLGQPFVSVGCRSCANKVRLYGLTPTGQKIEAT